MLSFLFEPVVFRYSIPSARFLRPTFIYVSKKNHKNRKQKACGIIWSYKPFSSNEQYFDGQSADITKNVKARALNKFSETVYALINSSGVNMYGKSPYSSV